MFSKAYPIASEYTHPVIISKKLFNNKVECGIGSFVILNDEGWIITAFHILNDLLLYNSQSSERNKYHSDIEQIELDTSLTKREKEQRKKRLKRKANDNWITNISYLWENPTFGIKNIKAFPENDLAIAQIENYNPSFQSIYPKFIDPKKIAIGTSLCKLGYPFHNVTATFDEKNNKFNIDPNVIPIPRFPLEGMYTRNLVGGKSKDQRYDIKFLETSSPGLKGQSGGPIFDSEGKIWAIQSRTNFLDLNFPVHLQKGGNKITEHQILNIGIGAHIDVIIKLLNENNVNYHT